jgi:hypothetical protein
MADHLSIWTIYDHPSDFPDGFIARRWEITGNGEEKTDDVVKAVELKSLQEHFAMRGLYRMPRYDEDDPVIVECWL